MEGLLKSRHLLENSTAGGSTRSVFQFDRTLVVKDTENIVTESGIDTLELGDRELVHSFLFVFSESYHAAR